MIKHKFVNALTIFLIMFHALLPVNALAMTITDQSDYAPGSVVTISGDNSDGAGFAAGETVHVDVSGPNGSALSCDATADDNAAWSCQVTVSSEDSAAGDYSYTATGETSGASQSGSFTVTAPPSPTVEPTQEPTQEPTVEPTTAPTVEPNESPTLEPTSLPTEEPSTSPTPEPSSQPTDEPTAEPTGSPAEDPKLQPTESPTPTPTGPILSPFITSDKDDYAPGELVTLTSGNWQPGESVHLIVNDVLGDSWRLSEDVLANSSGEFTRQFNLPDWFVAQYHVYAYGAISHATTWDFTDSQPTAVAIAAPTSVTVAPGGSAAYTVNVTMGGNATACNMTLSISGLPTGAAGTFSGGNSISTAANFSKTLTISTTNSGPPAGRTPAGTYSFTVTVTPSGCQGSGASASTNGTLLVTAATSLALAAPSPASVTAGSAGPVSLSATLTKTSDGSAVANATITFTVDGSSVGTATTNASGVATLSYNPSALTVGPHTIQASFSAQTISTVPYTASTSGTQTLTVNPAQAATSLSVASASATYGGTVNLSATLTKTSDSSAASGKSISFTLNGSSVGSATTNASGVATLNSVSLGSINAGTYATGVGASFAGDSGFSASNGTASLTVSKATPTITWNNPGDITYNAALSGTQLNATASVPGTFAYTPVSGTILNAGNGQTLSVLFTPTDTTNYNTATKNVSINVLKANATCVVNGYSGTYDGAAHGATGSCTGVGGASLSGLNLGASFTNVPGGTANWTFTDSTGNYNNQSGTASIVITKADAVCTINGYTGVYDAAAHGASGSCKGVGGVTLGGLNLGASFTNVPGGTANWSVSGGTNYNDQNGTAPIVITKADADCSSIEGYSGIYDAAAHGATGECLGIGGEEAGTLDLGESFTDVPGGTAAWEFTGNGNYEDQSDEVEIVITKADAVCTINGYTGVYDAAAHGATGSCKGVGGVTLSGLDLGAAFTDVPGGTANWSFSGGTNYNDQNGTAPIVITKAGADCSSIEGYSGVYDAAAHGASGSCKGVGGVTLGGLNLGASFTNVPGGTANWSFSGGTNYNNQNGTAAIVITKAAADCSSIEGYTGVYDAAAHGATGECLGIGGEEAGTLDLGETFTNVPGGTAAWEFTGNGNYEDQSGEVEIVITKADAVCTINGYSGVYDAAAHGASGSCKGVGGVTLGGLNLGASFTNVPGGTASWSLAGGTNYNDQNGTAAIVITKADAICTINGYSGVYDAAAHGATGECLGIAGEEAGTLDLGESFTDVPGGTAAWEFTGNGNYKDESGEVEIVITKANATCTINGYSGTYNAVAHGATGSCKGVGGVTLGGLNLGASFTNVPGGTANWSFSGGTNYNNQNGTAAIVITKADAECSSIEGYSGVYDAVAHGATGSCTGVGGEEAGTLDLGDSFTNVPGGTAAWEFTGNGNYKDQSGEVEIVITKADAICSVEGYSVTYDGTAHTSTGACTGVGGPLDVLTGLDLSGTTHTNAGTYDDDPWSFSNANYNDESGTADNNIDKADAECSVTGYDVTYDGSAHTATGSCSGVNDEDLTGLNLSGTTHTNAGAYPGDAWSFSNANYNDKSGTVDNNIDKADAVCDVTPYDVTYDGNEHTADGFCTGVQSEDLSGLLDLSGTVHTDAGTYSDSWSFAGNGNYNADSDTITDKIAKANADCSITGYTVNYNGAAHTATGSCTGVGGASDVLTGLNLSGTTHTNAGTYTDSWTFTDSTGNYNNQSGTVTDKINKVDPTCTITGYTVDYDGLAHTATGSCKGVLGETLTGLNLSGTTHTNAGTYTDTWTFTDSTGNYNNKSGTVTDKINKVNATISVNGYTGVYDGLSHCATGSATGVGGVNLSASLNLGACFTNVPGGTAHWTFTGGTNYNDASGDVAIIINTWTFKGFYQPVDNSGVWNTVKSGSTVPLKFEIFAGSTKLTDPVSVKSITSVLVACTTGTEDAIETLASPTGGTTLRYDATAGQFIFNWKTPSTAGKCYRVTVETLDGSKLFALFKLK